MQQQRQETKIAFLQQENQQLRDYVQDLNHLITLNKQVLNITLNLKTKRSEISLNQSLQIFKDQSLSPSPALKSKSFLFSNRVKNKHLKMVLEQLSGENTSMMKVIDTVRQERDRAQSKNLINNQISEQSQRIQNDMVTDLEDKILELRQQLQKKESKIQELEKTKPISDGNGLVIKYREIIMPTEAIEKLQEQIDYKIEQQSQIQRQLRQTKMDREHLLTINFVSLNSFYISLQNITQELNKIKTENQIKNTQKNFSVPDENYELPPDISYRQEDTVQIENTEGNDFLTSGRFPIKNKMQSSKKLENSFIMPKLNLKRAHDIQNAITKKQEEKMNKHKKKSKNKQFQKMFNSIKENLLQAKKILASEMIKNRDLKKDVVKLDKMSTKLQSNNQMLIQSNFTYQTKWEKIFHTLEFYKQFFKQNVDLLKIVKPEPQHGQSILLDNINLSGNRNSIDSPTAIIRQMKRQSEQKKNSSILDITDEEILVSDGEEQFFMGSENSEDEFEGLDKNFIQFQETKEHLIALSQQKVKIFKSFKKMESMPSKFKEKIDDNFIIKQKPQPKSNINNNLKLSPKQRNKSIQQEELKIDNNYIIKQKPQPQKSGKITALKLQIPIPVLHIKEMSVNNYVEESLQTFESFQSGIQNTSLVEDDSPTSPYEAYQQNNILVEETKEMNFSDESDSYSEELLEEDVNDSYDSDILIRNQPKQLSIQKNLSQLNLKLLENPIKSKISQLMKSKTSQLIEVITSDEREDTQNNVSFGGYEYDDEDDESEEDSDLSSVDSNEMESQESSN